MTNAPQAPRIFVDFHNSDRKGRVRLNTVGTIQDLNQLGLKLREGLHVVVYCHELEAEGMVVYSQEEKLWVAQIDVDKIRNRPIPAV